jgi:aldehyde dehydrogenase (NAD+)
VERGARAVCGDATIWKPSEKTPLTAIAVTKIAERVCRETGADPAIFTLLMGDRKTVGQKLADDPRIPLVSATGSTGWDLTSPKRSTAGWANDPGTRRQQRADRRAERRLDMATQSIFFGAVGTAGQRCTSTRRVIMHESVATKCAINSLAGYKIVADRKSARSQDRDGSADRQARCRHGAGFHSAIER